jgi:hypothetical protein
MTPRMNQIAALWPLYARHMTTERAAVVGLQVTDHVVRAARVEFRDHPRLTDAAELRLPAGIVVDGRIENELAVMQLLQRIWHQLSFHWEPILVALGSADALLLQLEMHDPNQTAALVHEVGPRAITEQVVTQSITSHHSVSPVAVALRSSVDRMVSMLDRAGLTIAAVDTTPGALVRTQRSYWQSGEDLALRYGDSAGIWSIRLGSTVHGTMRSAADQPATTTFDAVGLNADHRAFAGVTSLADVEISDRLSSRFSLAQLAVPIGAALGARVDPLLPIDLRQATPLDRGREHLTPAEPGVAWLTQELPAMAAATGRRRRR